MITHPMTEASFFLITLFFGAASFVFMMRFLLEAVNADTGNPISQFFMRLSRPLISIVSFIPSVRKFNVACFCIIIALEGLRFFLIALLSGMAIRVVGFLVGGLGESIQLAIQIYFFSILIRVIASWISPHTFNPFLSLIHQLTEPLLNRVRRLIPPFGIIDISPVVILIALQLLSILVARPLIQMGVGLPMGL
ncbi:MAG: YggT family protein [Gammaproteobacteria bacterium]|nr:YggT family protein [Gammaproteobacteria bacterium]